MIKYLVIISLIYSFVYEINQAEAESLCPASASQDIAAIIDKGIKLNEEFKNNSSTTYYKKLRDNNEKFYEENSLPCVKKAGSILGQKKNKKLAHSFFRFIVSHNNSADEELSYILGILWAESPATITEAIKNLPKKDKDFIVEQTKFGWMNVKTNFNQEIVLDRDKVIATLSN